MNSSSAVVIWADGCLGLTTVSYLVSGSLNSWSSAWVKLMAGTYSVDNDLSKSSDEWLQSLWGASISLADPAGTGCTCLRPRRLVVMLDVTWKFAGKWRAIRSIGPWSEGNEVNIRCLWVGSYPGVFEDQACMGQQANNRCRSPVGQSPNMNGASRVALGLVYRT